MKSKIVVIGLIDSLNKLVASELSSRLGYFFLDIDDFIAYELMDKQKIINLCGITYFKQQEEKIINNISAYEKTVMCCSYDVFFQNMASLLFQNSITIALRVTENDVKSYLNKANSKDTSNTAINYISYQERNEFLIDNCKIAVDVDVKSPNIAINEIIKKIKG